MLRCWCTIYIIKNVWGASHTRVLYNKKYVGGESRCLICIMGILVLRATALSCVFHYFNWVMAILTSYMCIYWEASAILEKSIKIYGGAAPFPFTADVLAPRACPPLIKMFGGADPSQLMCWRLLNWVTAVLPIRLVCLRLLKLGEGCSYCIFSKK